MQKFAHDIDFLFCLLNLEGIDFDFFVGKFLPLLILDKIDRTEGSLPYELVDFIVLHSIKDIAAKLRNHIKIDKESKRIAMKLEKRKWSDD